MASLMKGLTKLAAVPVVCGLLLMRKDLNIDVRSPFRLKPVRHKRRVLTRTADSRTIGWPAFPFCKHPQIQPEHQTLRQKGP